MGKFIYLISLLSSIDVVLTLVGIILAIISLIVSMGIVEEYGFDAKEMKEDGIDKLYKVLLIVTALSVAIPLAIPEKEEMYMIALTKDYEIEDVYQMSKGEVKSAIDYAFEKFENIADK
ncbi:hypothetical protein [uncultured Anaerococcus sp.]|uniref:hypothetical protein n=1 Tax=uncultured Anaerococcus sp. TaxID=293428 RepID=UPI0025DDA015|nr:hypothetical protein [uncultured Anaerococcus sp.]